MHGAAWTPQMHQLCIFWVPAGYSFDRKCRAELWDARFADSLWLHYYIFTYVMVLLVTTTITILHRNLLFLYRRKQSINLTMRTCTYPLFNFLKPIKQSNIEAPITSWLLCWQVVNNSHLHSCWRALTIGYVWRFISTGCGSTRRRKGRNGGYLSLLLLAPFCDPPDVLINFAGDEMTSCSVAHCPKWSLEMVIHALYNASSIV